MTDDETRLVISDEDELCRVIGERVISERMTLDGGLAVLARLAQERGLDRIADLGDLPPYGTPEWDRWLEEHPPRIRAEPSGAGQMTTELSDHAARLIAELPDDATRMTLAQLKQIAEATERVAQVELDAAEEHERILDAAKEREEPADRPLSEILGADECAAFEAAEGRFLDAERAGAALYAWEEHIGLHALGERLTGEPVPARPRRRPLRILGGS